MNKFPLYASVVSSVGASFSTIQFVPKSAYSGSSSSSSDSSSSSNSSSSSSSSSSRSSNVAVAKSDEVGIEVDEAKPRQNTATGKFDEVDPMQIGLTKLL